MKMRFLSAALALSMLPLLAGVARADDDNVKKECDKVFTEAKNLPKPNARSIYDYGKRVVEQGGKCLNEAAKSVGSGKSGRGQGAQSGQ